MNGEGEGRLDRIREEIRTRLDPDFDWVRPGPLPWTPAPADPRGARVALLTTGGLHLRGDRPFRAGKDPLGDTGFRLVPHGATRRELRLDAPYVDQRWAARDPEVALPMRALERLHREGVTGAPAPRHASFASGIVRPLPGLEESAARLLPLLREDGAGSVVLLPTCSLCVQSVALLARFLEAGGIPTVTITMLPELTRLVGAPRALAVRFPFGAPCGDPGNRDLQRAVLREALDLLAAAREPGTIVPSRHSWRRPPAPRS